MKISSSRWSVGQHPQDVAQACAHLIRRDHAKPMTRAIAAEAIGRYGPRLDDQTGRRIPDVLHTWIRKEFAYAREPHVEYVADLERTYRLRAGDCDCLTVALGTVAASVGIPTYVAWIWTGPNMAHVYPVLGRSWMPHDDPAPFWRCDPLLEHVTNDLGPGLDERNLIRC